MVSDEKKRRRATGAGCGRKRAREKGEETRNRLTREDGLKSAKHYTQRRALPPPPSAFLPPLCLPLFAVFASSCLCEAVTPGCRPSLPGPPSVLRLTPSSFTSLYHLLDARASFSRVSECTRRSSFLFPPFHRLFPARCSHIPSAACSTPPPPTPFSLSLSLSLSPRPSTMGRNICTSGQKSLDDRIIRSKWKMDFDTWITWPFDSI